MLSRPYIRDRPRRKLTQGKKLRKEWVKRSPKGRVLLSLFTSMQQVLECKLYPDPEHPRMIRFSFIFTE